MNIADGGPAFPVALMTAPNGQVYGGEFGMSVRDYFAAEAMVAEVMTASLDEPNRQALVDAAHSARRTVEAQIAVNAYSLADAMLKERAK